VNKAWLAGKPWINLNNPMMININIEAFGFFIFLPVFPVA
jgi:hypothetical protein